MNDRDRERERERERNTERARARARETKRWREMREGEEKNRRDTIEAHLAH